ncbi:MAG TPA: site-2 protease family protein [Candidatus Eisenbacteria bacterium]|jgi:Zn-dependent protease
MASPVSSAVVEALVFWYPAFVCSTCFHEAAHAWAAKLGGDTTAADAGLLTLSPLPHLKRSPVGLLVVPLLTAVTRGWAMGWASAPYGRAWAERYPRRAAWMAAAGPAANLVIAAVALACIGAGLATGRFRPPPAANLDCLVVPAKAFAASALVAFAAKGLSIVCVLNVLLAAFNLVPLPPLDGASVLSLLLPRPLADRWRDLVALPMMGFAGMLLAYRFGSLLTDPLLSALLALLYPGQYES